MKAREVKRAKLVAKYAAKNGKREFCISMSYNEKHGK